MLLQSSRAAGQGRGHLVVTPIDARLEELDLAALGVQRCGHVNGPLTLMALLRHQPAHPVCSFLAVEKLLAGGLGRYCQPRRQWQGPHRCATGAAAGIGHCCRRLHCRGSGRCPSSDVDVASRISVLYGHPMCSLRRRTQRLCIVIGSCDHGKRRSITGRHDVFVNTDIVSATMSLTEQSLYTNNAQIQNQIRNLASFSDPSRVQRGGT